MSEHKVDDESLRKSRVHSVGWRQLVERSCHTRISEVGWKGRFIQMGRREKLTVQHLVPGQDKGQVEPGSLVVESGSVECESRSEALVVRPSTSKMFNRWRLPLTRIRQNAAPTRLQYTPEREGGRPYRRSLAKNPGPFAPLCQCTDCGDWPSEWNPATAAG